MYSGETIKLLRLLKGFSQQGIARKLGISQAAYSKLEKRKVVAHERSDEILAIFQCSEEDIKSLERLKTYYIDAPIKR